MEDINIDKIDKIGRILRIYDRLLNGEKLYIISAEVFGDGIDIWLRSQGDRVEPLE